jgi:hypothetical protein
MTSIISFILMARQIFPLVIGIFIPYMWPKQFAVASIHQREQIFRFPTKRGTAFNGAHR